MMQERLLKMLRSLADLQLYDGELQTEGRNTNAEGQ